MNSSEWSISDFEERYKVEGSCQDLGRGYSNGAWYELLQNDDSIFSHSSVIFNLQLAIIFALTSALHFVLKRFHLPRLVSEFLAGLILGPSVLGTYLPDEFQFLFPKHSTKMLSNTMKFGYLFFMFLIGVKMDAGLLKKSGSKAWIIGGSTIIIPLLLIVSSAKQISVSIDKYYEVQQLEWVSIFSGTLMLTSFPVVACLLMQLKIINSELGHLALSTALICDITSVLIVNTDNYVKLVMLVSSRVGLTSVVLSLSLIGLILVVLRPMVYLIIRCTPEGKPVKNAYVLLVVIAAMCVALIGDAVGLQYLYGPFIFGLVVPTGPPLASTLVEKFDTIITGLMLPLLSTYCGFKANVWELRGLPPVFMVFVASCGFVLKFVMCFIPAVCCKVPKKDAVVLGLVLTTHGIVELGVIATNTDTQEIGLDQFTIAVLIVVFMVGAIPMVINSLYDPTRIYTGYQKRTILHSGESEGLRILVCAHNQHDAISLTKLLDYSNPTERSPLSVFGLYLEELVGGSTPLLLNHQLGQKISSFGGLRWQPVIDVFTRFKSVHPKSSNVEIFTAISPRKLIHDDICWMAFDKSASLVLLPFHKKWNSRGNTILNSVALRALNVNVLAKSPCSVGILVDRSEIRRKFPILEMSHFYRVAVVYMGGKDDLEALAYARRMAKCSSVILTVIKVVLICKDGHKVFENLVHEAYMTDMERSSIHCNIIFKEKKVKNGSETGAVIRSIRNEYDLILVGRRHDPDSLLTSGLSEFCELPELGFVGDLLASSEMNSPVSVLVIQQQIIHET